MALSAGFDLATLEASALNESYGASGLVLSFTGTANLGVSVEDKKVNIDPRSLIGHNCYFLWMSDWGTLVSTSGVVRDVVFVPQYGCFIDAGHTEIEFGKLREVRYLA